MRALKAAGVIEKIPGGRRPKGRRTRAGASEVKVIEQARAVVASGRAGLREEPVLPWQDQTHAEKLDVLTGKALDKTLEILDLPCDPGNLKLLAIQKDAALSVLATQVKVDENQLRERKDNDKLAAILEELAIVKAEKDVFDG